MSRPLRLGINIDHVATVRNARGGRTPDLVRAAELAIRAGADGITAHLREDRRHVRDEDLDALTRLLRSELRPLNLEMAVTEEMVSIALSHRPHAVCLVPERREERTTEGGLDVQGQHNWVTPAVRRLKEEGGARVSLFIAPDEAQVRAAADTGAQVVELHTGAFCDALREAPDRAPAELDRLRTAAALGAALGLEIHAGHGIDYDSVGPVAALPQLAELNIGHFLIGEAIFVGLERAISRMRELMQAARAEART